MCASLIFALSQARVASTERDRAFALATRNAAVTEFLGMLITEAAEGGKPVTVADMLARSERLAIADTSISTSLQGGFPYSMGTGHSYLMLGRSLHAVGDSRGARQAFETSVRHLSNTVDDIHPLLIAARQLAAQKL